MNPTEAEIKEALEFVKNITNEFYINARFMRILAAAYEREKALMEEYESVSAVMREWLEILRRTLQKFPESELVKDSVDKVGSLLEVYPAGKTLLKKLASTEFVLGIVMSENRVNLERTEKAEASLKESKETFVALKESINCGIDSLTVMRTERDRLAKELEDTRLERDRFWHSYQEVDKELAETKETLSGRTISCYNCNQLSKDAFDLCIKLKEAKAEIERLKK